MKGARPFLVAAICLALGPVVFVASRGERLAVTADGDLVLVRRVFWSERIVGRLDGHGDHWWLVRPDGMSEPWTWAAAPELMTRARMDTK